jgi:hypothetical protein
MGQPVIQSLPTMLMVIWPSWGRRFSIYPLRPYRDTETTGVGAQGVGMEIKKTPSTR